MLASPVSQAEMFIPHEANVLSEYSSCKRRSWRREKKVGAHCGCPVFLSQAIDTYYQTVKTYTVYFLKKFGYGWEDGRLYALAT